MEQTTKINYVQNPRLKKYYSKENVDCIAGENAMHPILSNSLIIW